MLTKALALNAAGVLRWSSVVSVTLCLGSTSMLTGRRPVWQRLVQCGLRQVGVCSWVTPWGMLNRVRVIL